MVDDIWCFETMQIHVDLGGAHHGWVDIEAAVIAMNFIEFVGCEALFIICIAVDVFAIVLRPYVIVCCDQKSGGTNSRVEHFVVFGGVNGFDDELDDVTRRAELANITLGASYRQQVFIGVADIVGFAVAKLIGFFEKEAQDIGRVEWQKGVLVDAAE